MPACPASECRPCNLIFKKSIIMVKQWSGTTLFVSGLGLKYTVHIYIYASI